MPHRVSRELCPQTRIDTEGMGFPWRFDPFGLAGGAVSLVFTNIRSNGSGVARKVAANCS